jgi:hypothetical protein
MSPIFTRLFFVVTSICAVFTASANEELNQLLGGLLYKPTEPYPAKSAVMISVDDGEIYTSKIAVPAAADGSNGPNGSNAATYWGDSTTTTLKFVEENPDFLSQLPNDVDPAELSKQVGALTNPSIVDDSRFYGLALRAYVGEFPVAGGIIINGTQSKKVMIRVKGPSMSFSGTKLNDPKISITKQNSAGVYETFLNSDNFGDHSSSTTYPDYTTGNAKEPAVVVDMEPGTYGVRVEDASGAQGNANVEFYEVDDDTSSSRFYGLALRAYVGEFPVAGGIIIKGTQSKKVMIRVKGPSMSFSGTKLNDPKISITKQNSAGVYETFLNSDNFGDHSSSTSYPDYTTGNAKEPAVVVDLEPGTYGVRVEDAGGAQGNANVEFYEVD